jgi:nitrogen fixation NifU-like protein
MEDLHDLYQSVILDHNRSPRNFRELEDASHQAEGYNPLCGDRLTVWLQLEGDRIASVTFHGSGCAISKASASMMTEAVKGKTAAEVKDLAQRFLELVTGRSDPATARATLGKLAVFSGVSEFPVRVKCASLSWHTLKAALNQETEAVTTE